MVHIKSFFVDILPGFLSDVFSVWFDELLSMTPLMLGILLQIVIVSLLILVVRGLKDTKFSILFEYILEAVYNFFEEVLGKTGKPFVKNYIVTLFFVILLSNISGWLIDWVRMIFVDIERLTSIITIPTTSLEFNMGLAIVGILLMLFIQVKYTGGVKTFLEYVPLGGKGIIKISKGNLSGVVYYPLWFIIKLFDIAISLFVGALDIIGIFAKIISLSARLYGNMISGGILLTMLVVGINVVMNNIVGSNFPVLATLILYAQGLLVATIQAFVFPLLVAIFIKLAIASNENEEHV